MLTRFVHYMIQFLPRCDKCPFKGKTQGDLKRHILWTWRPQCRLCEYRPTQKSAMTKQIDLVYGQLTKYKNRLSVFVLSVDLPLPPEQDLTSTLNVRWEAFQLWTFLKDIYPESCASAPVQGKNRHVKFYEFGKTNMLQTIKCLTGQEPSKISQNGYKMGWKDNSHSTSEFTDCGILAGEDWG